MPRVSSAARLTVELDVSYQPHKRSGITTYSLALAQELAADPAVDLILCRGAGDISPQYPAVPVRRLGWLDRLRVPQGRVRVIPHQMRPVPAFGSVIVTVHDVIPLGPWSPARRRIPFRTLLWLLRVRRARILADSAATRDRLSDLGFRTDDIAVRHPSLPTRVAPEQPPACGGGGIAYIGNLLPHKDIPTLVAAHQRLARESQVRLHVVTSDESDALDRLRASYDGHQADTLCVHLRATDAERDAVLRFATVVATPSLEEGFGYAIDEALSLGTPVVASAIPAHAENAVGRDVTLFPPGAVDALAEALGNRLSSPARARDTVGPSHARTDAATVIRRLIVRP